MVGTIAPIVYGEIKSERPTLILGIHVLGYVFGGFCFGWMLGTVGILFFSGLLASNGQFRIVGTTAFVTLWYGLYELNLAPALTPQFRKQVPVGWRRRPFERMALVYGLALGMGIGTRIPVGTFYVVVLWAVLCQHPIAAGVCLAVFGIGRALPLLAIWVNYRMRGIIECGFTSDRAGGWISLVHVVNGLALATAAASFTSAILLGQ